MANYDFQKALNLIENSNLKAIIQHLLKKLEEKDDQIRLLTNRVVDLEQRVNECEKYSSKDSIIFDNLPLRNDNTPLSHQVCDFLQKYLNFTTHPQNFKACHVLGKWKDTNSPPGVIIKFLYYGEKNEIFGRKSWLAGIRNPLNGRPIFMKERLPPLQREIKKEADQLGLITTTMNCDVKVFKKSDDNKFMPIVVNSLKAVHDIKNTAVKRANRGTKDKPPVNHTPLLTCGTSKRPRCSPGDGNIEKFACFESSTKAKTDIHNCGQT